MIALLLMTVSAAAEEPTRGSDAHVHALVQQALDDALRHQVEHLFANWMKDASGQPARAASGLRKAVTAYRHAIEAMQTERLSWQPQRRNHNGIRRN